MNSSSSSSTLPADLALVQLNLIRYVLVPTYIFGNLGNGINLILFSQRNIRSNNICAWYFICVSLANLFTFNTGCITRILSFLANFNLEITSIIFCKLRNYCIQSSAVLGRYFLCLISIERWMVTSKSERIRRMSTPKIAKRLIIIGVCTITIFNVHIPIGFQISNKRCYASLNPIYVLFFNIYNIIIIFVPFIIMTLCSLLILNSIRKSHRIVAPVSPAPVNEAFQQRESQFIRLALIQSFSFIIFAIGYGIYNAYDFATSSIQKSSDRLAIEAFVSGVVVNCNYISSAVRSETSSKYSDSYNSCFFRFHFSPTY